MRARRLPRCRRRCRRQRNVCARLCHPASRLMVATWCRRLHCGRARPLGTRAPLEQWASGSAISSHARPGSALTGQQDAEAGVLRGGWGGGLCLAWLWQKTRGARGCAAARARLPPLPTQARMLPLTSTQWWDWPSCRSCCTTTTLPPTHAPCSQPATSGARRATTCVLTREPAVC